MHTNTQSLRKMSYFLLGYNDTTFAQVNFLSANSPTNSNITSQMMAMLSLVSFFQCPLDGAMVHEKKSLLFSNHITL